jgi:NAD(P)-dependent dehydrogenase (short-subunit alcohol dehydrogenase family)
MNLQNRVALVTGAGSGIGKAAALRMARAGARIGVLDHTEENAQKTVAAIQAAGGEALALAADISSEPEMIRAYARLASKWDRLDVVFANAGVNGVWAPLDQLTTEEFNSTLNINLTGTFLTLKYALPLLRRQGGSVIITSSVNGTRIFSNAGATAYSCSKAAQVALTKMAALELAKDRIRVNVICPGAIETNIDDNTEKRDIERAQEPVEFPEGAIPLTDGEPGRSEQVADLVLFLASDASSHISGTEIWIDGAGSLLQG